MPASSALPPPRSGSLQIGSLQVGFAAMLEQLDPREAVELSAYAEQHGFDGVMASDHFQPWLPQQGQAPFVWAVLAAIAARTKGDFGPGVTTPGYRMHPAAVAQASATLAAMHPGRHWLGIGSGDALSEHIVGQYWPEAPERINRMFEAIEIIKRLFATAHTGRDTRFSGNHFTLESTRLWTAPETPPEILVATAGPLTARRAGRSADGLITTNATPEKLAALLERFATGAREAGKDPATMPRVIQWHVSVADTLAEAEASALEHWPNGAMRFNRADIRHPQDFAHLARTVRVEDCDHHALLQADPAPPAGKLRALPRLGLSHVSVHHVGRDQRAFIDRFGAEVLPLV